MENEDFIKKMEALQKPETDKLQQPDNLKLTLFNARKSAAIGVWMVAVPCYFLFCVFMKYFFHTNLHIFDIAQEFISSLDKNPRTKYVSPVFLMLLPLLSIILNSLSMLHFEYNKPARELLVSVKLRWFNILLLVLSVIIAITFFLYLIAENYRH